MDMAVLMSELEDELRTIANEHGGKVEVIRAEPAEVVFLNPPPVKDASDTIIEGEYSSVDLGLEEQFPDDVIFSDGTSLDDE